MTRAVSQRRRETQSGFILLVIFLMAAMIAMMLYQQLPRVAFESERDKEQLLMERGEQYMRAIELFAKEYNKLPATIDELEKTNNKRYLRKRYKDPYTGKEEWRLIHATGPGGQLTDSLVQKAKTDPNASNSSSSTTTQNGQQQTQEVNVAVLQRPSDVTQPNNQSFQGPLPGALQPGLNQGSQMPPGTPVAPSPQQGVNGQNPLSQAPPQGFGLPGQGLPQGVAMPGGVATNGTAQGQQGQQGQNGTPGFTPQFPGQQFPGQAPPSGFQPQFPGQQFPGQLPPSGVQPTNPQQTLPNGQPVPAGFQIGPNGQLIPAPIGQNSNLPGGIPGGLPGSGLPGAGATPGLPGGASSAGVNLINDLLRKPSAAPIATTQSNGVGTGGIAGVASMHEGPSIGVYKDRQKYQEWEFVYTPQQQGAPVITPPVDPKKPAK